MNTSADLLHPRSGKVNDRHHTWATPELHPLVPDLTARFQLGHLRTFFPADHHAELQIPYVQANLLAVKDGPRQGGPLLC